MASPLASETLEHRSPEPEWQWWILQWGILLFFVFPSPSFLLLGLALVGMLKQEWAQIRQRPLSKALFALFLLQLLTAVGSDRPLDALLGIGNFAPFYLLFVAFAELFRRPHQLKRLAFLATLGSIPHIFLGWGQMLWNWTTPEWWGNFSGWSVKAQGEPWGRMAAGFMYANTYGFYLVVVLCLTLGLWFVAWQDWRRTRERATLIRGLGLGLILVGNASTLWMTESRNAWASAALGMVMLLAIARWWFPLGMLAGLGGAVLWAAFLPQWGGAGLREVVPFHLWGRLAGEMYVLPDALSRTAIWQFALGLMGDRPWLGWGNRSFEFLYEPATGHWVAHPHNLFLLWGVEWGIPIAILTTLWVGWIVAQGVRQAIQEKGDDRLILLTILIAFGAATVFNLLDVSLFDLRGNVLGWLLLSAITGINYSNPRSQG